MITEDEIAQVMTETGMGRPDPFPLGESAYDVPEQQSPKGD